MIIEQLLKTSSVERLKGLIANRYGKQLRIQAMAEVTDLTQLNQSHLCIGHDLRIPITSNDKYMCTAVVDGGAGLGSEEAVSISHLVRMILEPLFYDFYLEQKKENSKSLSLVSKAESARSSTNVVTIENLDEQYFRTDFHFEKTKGQLLFLMTRNPALITKSALEVHEIKRKWAFLKYSDIRDRIQTPEDLISLGDITILVDDILMLNPNEREVVMDYIFATHAGATPMILIGVSSALTDLEHQALVGADWLKMMKHFALELDRLPADTKKLRQALELFLEPAFEV